MATQTTSTLTQEQKTFYDRNLLSRLLPNLVFLPFGQSRPMPAREGQTVQFRRFSSLSAATTPLTEGTTPSGSSLTVSTVTSSPAQYGDFVEISDILDFTGIDPVLMETGELLGEQAANTIDTIVRDAVVAGTTLQYANGRASRVTVAVGDILNSTEIKKAVRTMQANKVKKISSILDASTGVGTKPVNAAYVGIVGPSGLYDLKADTKFVGVEAYADKSNLLPFEVGAMDDVRFILSHNTKVYTGAGAAGVDVHATLIVGQDAFGVVAPMGVENIVKPFGAGNDPLNQRATSGWKAFFSAVILQQLSVLRVEHGVSV